MPIRLMNVEIKIVLQSVLVSLFRIAKSSKNNIEAIAVTIFGL